MSVNWDVIAEGIKKVGEDIGYKTKLENAHLQNVYSKMSIKDFIYANINKKERSGGTLTENEQKFKKQYDISQNGYNESNIPQGFEVGGYNSQGNPYLRKKKEDIWGSTTGEQQGQPSSEQPKIVGGNQGGFHPFASFASAMNPGNKKQAESLTPIGSTAAFMMNPIGSFGNFMDMGKRLETKKKKEAMLKAITLPEDINTMSEAKKYLLNQGLNEEDIMDYLRTTQEEEE